MSYRHKYGNIEYERTLILIEYAIRQQDNRKLKAMAIIGSSLGIRSQTWKYSTTLCEFLPKGPEYMTWPPLFSNNSCMVKPTKDYQEPKLQKEHLSIEKMHYLIKSFENVNTWLMDSADNGPSSIDSVPNSSHNNSSSSCIKT